MKTSFDVIVVGLGAVGSAATYHLARRNQRVLGLDRFVPPHTFGSSHGGSRIIRKAYFEGSMYLPLIDRAYTLWRDLEMVSGQSLMRLVGGLNVGPPEGAVAGGARRVAEACGLAHEVLDPAQVQARFPAFQMPEGHVAVWEQEAGLLDPEACIRAHLEQAQQHGAVLHTGEHVTDCRPDGEGVQVTTAYATYRAQRLALCAGGWLRALLPDLDLPLVVERQVNGWFRPQAHPDHFHPDQCPVYIWDVGDGDVLYGFPDLGLGIKVGLHHQGPCSTHPEAVERTVSDADIAALRRPLCRLLPDADGTLIHATTCLYTNTPDRHYLIDRHPAHPQMVFASACSGHGFKASNAVGEALADLALEQPPRVDLRAFGWRDFAEARPK